MLEPFWSRSVPIPVCPFVYKNSALFSQSLPERFSLNIDIKPSLWEALFSICLVYKSSIAPPLKEVVAFGDDTEMVLLSLLILTLAPVFALSSSALIIKTVLSKSLWIVWEVASPLVSKLLFKTQLEEFS